MTNWMKEAITGVLCLILVIIIIWGTLWLPMPVSNLDKEKTTITTLSGQLSFCEEQNQALNILLDKKLK